MFNPHGNLAEDVVIQKSISQSSGDIVSSYRSTFTPSKEMVFDSRGRDNFSTTSAADYVIHLTDTITGATRFEIVDVVLPLIKTETYSMAYLVVSSGNHVYARGSLNPSGKGYTVAIPLSRSVYTGTDVGNWFVNLKGQNGQTRPMYYFIPKSTKLDVKFRFQLFVMNTSGQLIPYPFAASTTGEMDNYQVIIEFCEQGANH